jgi:serine/threonine-protein kinase
VPSRWIDTLAPGLQLATSGRSNPVAVSPDGARIVYAAETAGNPQLYLRDLDRFETREVPGTEGARNPFFSADGKWLGFFAANRLLKVSLEGGLPRTVCETRLDDLGATWSADGFIVFALYGSGLFRVSSEGGEPEPLTSLDYGGGEVQHRWPQILPDGEHVLFTVATAGGSRVEVLSLIDGSRRSVSGLVDVSRAWYAPGGQLVFGQAGGLMAVALDLARMEVGDDPVSVLDGVSSVPDLGNAYFSISESGTIVYVPGDASGETELVWVDRKGQESPAVQGRGSYMHVRLSPDGRRVASSVGSEIGRRRLLVYDLLRGTRSVLAEEGSNAYWSPDGSEVIFSSNRSGSWNLYRTPSDGSGSAQLLFDSEREQWIGSWLPDGTAVSFYEVNPEGGRDIWTLPLDGGPPEPFVVTPFNERSPRFSPDGRWLAYVSNESGRDEVYVTDYPDREGRWTLSSEGGREPVWSQDGTELFYRQGDRMLVVDVDPGPPFVAARPQTLFEGRYEVGVAGNPDYDVSPDGRRFLMIKRSEGSAPIRLHVILNWFAELERLVPAGN